MISPLLKKTLIFLYIATLTTSAFFIRLENFPRPKLRTIDEIVYLRLAEQIMQNPRNYTSIPYGTNRRARGFKVPDYFFQPLFKHPPLFPYLGSVAMKIQGNHPISFGAVAVLFGALLIPLTYLLAVRVSNRRAALLSALFIFMDPIHIICSQKIWMETTMVFFMTLTVYFFIRGGQSRRWSGWWFLGSGIAGGLAGLTKYPGLLAPAAVLIYAVLFRPQLVREKKLWVGLSAAAALMYPWLMWNYVVYGTPFLYEQIRLHIISNGPNFIQTQLIHLAGLSAAVIVIVFGWKKLAENPAKNEPFTSLFTRWPWMSYVLLLAMTAALARPILYSLMPDYVPVGSWVAGLFRHENLLFYPGRLIEFSFIYALGLMALCTDRFSAKTEILAIKTAALVSVIFFSLWGNFQSRYILPATPFLIILGGCFGEGLWRSFSNDGNHKGWLFGRAVLLSVLLLVLWRGHHINQVFSFPHEMCYF